jgi:hypothetical protein
MAISRHASPPSLPDLSAAYCQRPLVDESGMIKTQIGTHNTSEMVALLGTPCAIPPHNSIILLSTTELGTLYKTSEEKQMKHVHHTSPFSLCSVVSLIAFK